MEMVTNAINWFEIPVSDFERAKAFYSTIFDYEMPVFPMGSVVMGILPYENNKSVGGAILQTEGHEPSVHGPRVYLNGGTDLNIVLGRVAAAGGTVLTEKTLVAEDIGYCAFFLDSEGNKLALHSPK